MNLKDLLVSINLNIIDIDYIIEYGLSLFDLCKIVPNVYKNKQYKDIKTVMFLRTLVGIVNYLPFFFCDHGHLRAIFYNTTSYQQYIDFYKLMKLFWACKELSYDFKNICFDHLKKSNYNCDILNGLIKFRLFNKKYVRHIFFDDLTEHTNGTPFYAKWYIIHRKEILTKEKLCKKINIKIFSAYFNYDKLEIYYGIDDDTRKIQRSRSVYMDKGWLWQSQEEKEKGKKNEKCIVFDLKKHKHISYFSFGFLNELVYNQLIDHYYDNYICTKNIKKKSFDKLLFLIRLNTEIKKNNSISENFIENN